MFSSLYQFFAVNLQLQFYTNLVQQSAETLAPSLSILFSALCFLNLLMLKMAIERSHYNCVHVAGKRT